MPRRLIVAAATCVVAGLGLAGCGSTPAAPGASGTAASPPSPGSSAPTSPAPPASTVPVPSPPGGPSTTPPPVPPPKGTSPVAVVVRGVVEKGVELGCWVLVPDQGGPRYVLMSRDAPPTGVPVTVYGTTRPDQLSYCMQGTVLQATRIERR